MKYLYYAYTKDRKVRSGTIYATSGAEAEEAILKMGFERVLNVQDVRTKVKIKKSNNSGLSMFSATESDIMEFSRELANLLYAGIPVLTALEILEKQTRKAAFREVLTDIATNVRGGKSFTEAISKHPKTFSTTYCAVMKAAGQTGDLGIGLKELTEYMEKQQDIKKRIRHAVMYPVLVVGLAIGVGALMVTTVLPPMINLFKSLGTNLPLITRLVVAIASFVISNKFYILAAMVGLPIMVAGYMRLPSGRYNIDNLLLHIPLIGQIVLRTNLLHFSRTSAMLLESGMQIYSMLATAVATITNRKIRASLAEAEKVLLRGQPFSQAMAATGMFPAASIETLVIGEKTGELETALRNIANYFERSNKEKVDGLVAMIEPALTIAIGLGVGLIALSIITPMYSITSGF